MPNRIKIGNWIARVDLELYLNRIVNADNAVILKLCPRACYVVVVLLKGARRLFSSGFLRFFFPRRNYEDSHKPVDFYDTEMPDSRVQSDSPVRI